MKNVRHLALALALAASSLSVACSGGTTDAQQPQTSASAMTKAPVGASTHGMVKVVGEALGEVALRPDQRSELEKLATEADTRHASTLDGRKDLMNTIADQIEKGSIDRSALQPKIDALVASHQKIQADDQAALVKMHALLDADQRGAFVDALRAKLEAKHGEHGHHEGFAKMKQWKEDLKLTDDQISQIKDVMKQARKDHELKAVGKDIHQEMRSRKDALESFRTEKFDAQGLAHPIDADKASKGTEHFVGFAEKVLPILTAEQRKIAADKIRDLAAKGEMGPFGH